MKKVLFLDSIGQFDHVFIKNKPVGGAEYQFYNLILELKKYLNYETYCYNLGEKKILNGIHYDNLKNLNISKNDVVILIRDPDKNLINKIKNSEKIIFWRHGLCSKKYSEENKEILDVITNFVFPSEYAKDQFLINNPNKKTNVIYNILYEEDFLEIRNLKIIKKNQITFASAWHKGLYKIVDLFEKISQYQNFNFIFMRPNYGGSNFEKEKEYINLKLKNYKILEKQNKKEYSKIIKESLCVFAPPFNETFGCVFAESLYLGTPVIYDHKTQALDFLVGNSTKCNYENYEEIYKKLLEIIKNPINVKLKDVFLLEYNIKIWEKLIEE